MMMLMWWLTIPECTWEEWPTVIGYAHKLMRPRYYSYLSQAGVKMDSVVYRHPSETLIMDDAHQKQCQGLYKQMDPNRYKRTKQYIAATLASRTLKMRREVFA